MSEIGSLLRAEIESCGPIPFSRFMEVALYHRDAGYYTGTRDPFGRAGDFYTATQMQPVFGRLVASVVAGLRDRMGAQSFQLTEWGAGRGELREFLGSFGYSAVEWADARPPRSRGVLFSNELFDALPVDVVRRSGGGFAEMRVGVAGGRFVFVPAAEVAEEWLEYARCHASVFPEDAEVWMELPVRVEETVRSMANSLTEGEVIAIDYGYTQREAVRFPRGTILSYREHRAVDDVLLDPGEQDITAHVPFDFLRTCAKRSGLKEKSFETLAQWILRAGEPDSFESALHAASEEEALRLRLQLKSLLFGMGESFRVLTFGKE
jgi:SAM-dependent MidA family methyltransferase